MTYPVADKFALNATVISNVATLSALCISSLSLNGEVEYYNGLAIGALYSVFSIMMDHLQQWYVMICKFYLNGGN